MSSNAADIFGIDLGTTYSAIAYVDEFGKPIVILNEDDEPATASTIFFESNENIIVGKVAKSTGRLDPMNYIELIKPYMGDPTYPPRELHGKQYRPEELSAIILKKLKSYAETKLGREIKNVVITVPAYFNEQQRNATEQAGILAGFEVKRIIPEPTAAAIAYAATDEGERSVLVYDLGGGTFDVTVMQVAGQKIRVVCIKGVHDLGGRLWDDAIATHLASSWQNEHGAGEDLLANLETRQDLLNSAEESKKQLSQRTKVPVKVSHAGKSTRVDLTREKFDELTASLLETTMALTRDAAAEAVHLGVPRLDLILLVGGSSRMPQVQERLKAQFPGVDQKLFDPELAVAKGAALYANSTRIQEVYADALEAMFGRRDVKVESLAPAEQQKLQEQVSRALPGASRKAIAAGLNLKVVNVCSKNFGLVVVTDSGTRREEVAYLIKRNSPVPTEVEDQFGTLDANQHEAMIQIIESDFESGPNRPLPKEADHSTCRRLKNIALSLPPGLAANHPIKVKYSLSEDGGRLRVFATDPVSGRAIDDTVENLSAIQPQELETMKQALAAKTYQ
jgi:molecular chaperone DnaK